MATSSRWAQRPACATASARGAWTCATSGASCGTRIYLVVTRLGKATALGMFSKVMCV
jgi:hypothetical protein